MGQERAALLTRAWIPSHKLKIAAGNSGFQTLALGFHLIVPSRYEGHAVENLRTDPVIVCPKKSLKLKTVHLIAK
jgi:hypothetical protein